MSSSKLSSPEAGADKGEIVTAEGTDWLVSSWSVQSSVSDMSLVSTLVVFVAESGTAEGGEIIGVEGG